ncbi:MAG: cytochrome c [Rudaea sp.]|uniref:c-type cytochrome n=1 Tax=Rudaea sp. TaxID=2136325 RepID=UPI0039E31C93
MLALLAGNARADDNGAFSNAELKVSTGEQVYQHICQGCHMPDGRGAVGAGRYPAFAGDPALASTRYVTATVLYGRRNMPSFIERPSGSGDLLPFMRAVSLGDEQIAGVVNYIRTHFGNHYSDKLTAADVAALRQKK